MYIANIKISNMLRFHDQSNVDLDFKRPNGGYAGWTVLVGRNGSGKTSLLRCIALAIGGHEVASRIASSYITWRFDAESEGRMRAEFYLDRQDLNGLLAKNHSLKPGIHLKSSLVLGVPKIDTEKKTAAGAVKWEFELPGDEVDPQIDEEVWAKELVKQLMRTKNSFAAGYGPFRYLPTTGNDSQVTPFEEDDPTGILATANRFASLFREDASLGASVAWLVMLHHRKLENRRGASRLLDTVLELLSDGLLPDDYRIIRVDSRGLWVRHGGKAIPLRDLSDGYRAVTALVLDIVRALHQFYGELSLRRTDEGISIRSPGIILIDEIDAHLHVSWQKEIGGWLKRHFPRVQFIVSTHSPYVCQAADPGGLIRLPGPGDSAGPEHVSDSLYRRIIYGSGDDAVLSELFGLDSLYSERAEVMRRELIELEGRIFGGTATKGEEERYHHLTQTLSSSSNARINEITARLAGRQ